MKETPTVSINQRRAKSDEQARRNISMAQQEILAQFEVSCAYAEGKRNRKTIVNGKRERELQTLLT